MYNIMARIVEGDPIKIGIYKNITDAKKQMENIWRGYHNTSEYLNESKYYRTENELHIALHGGDEYVFTLVEEN